MTGFVWPSSVNNNRWIDRWITNNKLKLLFQVQNSQQQSLWSELLMVAGFISKVNNDLSIEEQTVISNRFFDDFSGAADRKTERTKLFGVLGVGAVLKGTAPFIVGLGVTLKNCPRSWSVSDLMRTGYNRSIWRKVPSGPNSFIQFLDVWGEYKK